MELKILHVIRGCNTCPFFEYIENHEEGYQQGIPEAFCRYPAEHYRVRAMGDAYSPQVDDFYIDPGCRLVEKSVLLTAVREV